MTSSRKFEEYHGYTIVHNNTGARLLTSDGVLAHTKTFGGLDLAKEWIDAHLQELKSERRAGHVATVEGYMDALRTQVPNAKEQKMLGAHSMAEDRRMTADDLATVAGWKRYSSANLHYGKLGKRLAEQLKLKIDGDNNHAFIHAIGEYDDETSEWIMHEELAAAVSNLNIS